MLNRQRRLFYLGTSDLILLNFQRQAKSHLKRQVSEKPLWKWLGRKQVVGFYPRFASGAGLEHVTKL
jgi:hypothetical protein